MPTAIDLRADTVTLPTPRMKEAMISAEVGDDVFGEDPTVNRLQRLAADMLGKEDALFTASGTMSNLVATLTHCGRGEEMIVGADSHMFHFEVGGASTLGSVNVRTVPNRQGTMDPAEVEAAIRGNNIHLARTRLVCLENTHIRHGGAVLAAEQISAVVAVARRHGLKVHIDGARLFNAAVALGVEAKSLVQGCDSVSVSLSKGLGAPVGSLLLGTAGFIDEARRYRKMVGGGMRQAGVIAAAGIVALEEMVDRLAVDHSNARRLAQGLVELPGVRLDMSTVQSNIVLLEIARPDTTGPQFVAGLGALGVLSMSVGDNLVRMMTHYGVSRDDIDRACEAARRVLVPHSPQGSEVALLAGARLNSTDLEGPSGIQ